MDGALEREGTLIPCVKERVDLIDGTATVEAINQYASAVEAIGKRRLRIARLTAHAVKTQMPGGFLVEVTVDHFVSRSMIHSTSGAGMKRHLRNGPAITLR